MFGGESAEKAFQENVLFKLQLAQVLLTYGLDDLTVEFERTFELNKLIDYHLFKFRQFGVRKERGNSCTGL